MPRAANRETLISYLRRAKIIPTQPTALFTLPRHRIICLHLPEFIEQDAIRNKWKLRDVVRQMKTRDPLLARDIYGPVSRTSC